MIDMLKKNNKIIVNTDIDGVLSAFILCKYCGCEIVGYSNSEDGNMTTGKVNGKDYFGKLVKLNSKFMKMFDK